jgi:hypothetical protein
MGFSTMMGRLVGWQIADDGGEFDGGWGDHSWIENGGDSLLIMVMTLPSLDKGFNRFNEHK